jgi:hypothetical protein
MNNDNVFLTRVLIMLTNLLLVILYCLFIEYYGCYEGIIEILVVFVGSATISIIAVLLREI